MRRTTAAALVAIATVSALAATVPARAAFHLMKVREVFSGAPGNANVQYVELQMYSNGQNQVGGHSVGIYNNAGIQVGTFTFAAAVANGANQSYILVATAEAQTYFGVTADLLMTPVTPQSGGAACFDNIDCVLWGNFAGNLPSPAGAPFNPAAGLVTGQSAERKINGGNNAAQLDSGDDTNNSANDFQSAAPSPTNNAGQTGQPSTTPAFASASYLTSEWAGPVTLTATRGNTAQAKTVEYATQDGTAASGQDYTNTTGSLSFAVGDASKSFNVPILDDGVVDAEEQFTVQLKENGNTIDTTTVTICGNLPSAPRTLTATASGQNTINLAWQAPLCGGDTALTGYFIYEGTNPNPTTVLTTVAPGQTSYSRTGLSPGSTRYYLVSATNNTGESAKSNQAQATTASNDTRNPTVTFSTSNNSVILAGSPAIAGTATDDQAVVSLTAAAYNIRGMKERDLAITCTGCGTASATFTVNPAGLLPGVYLIRVIAKDSAFPTPKSGSADLTVIYVS